jgi:diaminohydroxyphosphoribosylaminopyrimidine deaminase/5-amino-6-(5-phosphoribosylamino)uracil reductase
MSEMRRALSLARRALGSVSPNPAVGAVVVKNGVVVGEGWTQPPGGHHAEVAALEQAGDAARGAVLYVSLEPCTHHGRTPPCVDALLAAGISEARVAIADPNSSVTGGGVERLRDAGVRVVVGELRREAATMLEAYLKWVGTGRPFVTAKFAMSLDGKIATRTGDSKWITGDRARWHVHDLRATSDAVMVGINTVLADDPLLTARERKGRPLGRQPVRVVIDSRARLPENARLLSHPGEVLVAAASRSATLADAGVEVAILPSPDGTVDLERLLYFLGGQRAVTSVLVEGGKTLLGSLFDLGLVDKVVAFVAPTIIGGDEAPAAIGGRGVDMMSDALRLERVKVRRFGRDTAITGYC